jgi:hypothetical protein
VLKEKIKDFYYIPVTVSRSFDLIVKLKIAYYSLFINSNNHNLDAVSKVLFQNGIYFISLSCVSQKTPTILKPSRNEILE